MRSRLVRTTFPLVSALLGCGASTSPRVVVSTPQEIDSFPAVVDIDARRPNDTEERRLVELDNGLQALLISDPSLQKSAAALDVAAGSLEDPRSRLGLAHFLEHMLFLGTEKYPDAQEYKEYLSQNQGAANAYTAADHTNYQFQVNHDAFTGALDRFSQFFVAPLFTEDLTAREINAVNSEHQKNLQNDFWRTRMVERALHRDGHPRQSFSTGNLSTLEGVTREELLGFYKRLYSANVMKLCVMSTVSLDELEASVREKFSTVPSHDREAITYPSDVFDAENLPELIQVRSISDLRQLKLTFAMPPTTKLWQEKPARLMSSLLGHEGEGSLLSQLKKENLATGLSAGIDNETWSGYFNLRLTLTDHGRAQLPRILELFFTCVESIRSEGLTDRHFAEEKTMSELNFFYRDHEEGMWVAAHMAAQMQYRPPLEIIKQQYLYTRYDPELFARYVNYLRPENLRAVLVAPDVETDRIEPHYGTEFSIRRLSAAEVPGTPRAEDRALFHLPAPNPFIPTDLSLLNNDPQQGPYRLIDDERGEFWFEQDRRFGLPKARVSVLLHSEEISRTPRHSLLGVLYVKALSEGLNEWNYPVREAGLRASVDYDERGLRLRFHGFSQKIPELMAAFAQRLTTINIDETVFAAIKEGVARDLANAAFRNAYEQAFAEADWLLTPWAHHASEMIPLVEEVSLADVRDFSQQVLRRTAIEGVAYGNLDGNELRAGLDRFFAAVAAEVLPPAQRKPVSTRIVLPEDQALAHVFSTKSDNHCWLMQVPFGARSAALQAQVLVGAALLRTPFYAEMRTKQQLGYVVFSGPLTSGRVNGMFFAIQSGDYPATELANRAHGWLEAFLPTIRDIDDEEFETIKASVIQRLEEEETDMSERLRTLAQEALVLNGDFAHDDAVIAAVRELSKEELGASFAHAIGNGHRPSLSLYYDALDSAASLPRESRIESPADFKKLQPTLPPLG